MKKRMTMNQEKISTIPVEKLTKEFDSDIVRELSGDSSDDSDVVKHFKPTDSTKIKPVKTLRKKNKK